MWGEKNRDGACVVVSWDPQLKAIEEEKEKQR
jgi:hypothetical protein